MATTSLPPGFRFHPTDVELVLYYLKRKVLGKPLSIEAITELDLYKFEPWDLPEKSCLRSKDLVWYFFCPRDRKYANGPRTNRATGIGYWKTTGRDRAVCNDSQTVGMKKTLIFHVGRAPQGTRTNWVMHEYRLEIKDWVDSGISQDSYVLAKIFEKSGAGPKNGEQHGAPFKEEEWEDHSVDKSFAPVPHAVSSPSIIVDDEKNSTTGDTTLALGKTSNESCLKPPCQNDSSNGAYQNDSFNGSGDQNDSSNVSGENLSLIEDVDTDSTTSNEENDPLRSQKNNNEETCISALLALKTVPSVEDKEEPLGVPKEVSRRRTGKRTKKFRPVL